jgi:inositol-pentakisphosphate 2-kinase
MDRLAKALIPFAAMPSLAQLRERFVLAIVPTLVQSSVLPVLSKLQRSLDILDAEGLDKLWKSVHGGSVSKSALALVATSDEPSITEWRSFLDRYLTDHESMDHAHPDPTNLRYYTLAYLLSMSFKDCSIIVRPAESGQGKASITIIDLDAKSIKSLVKWQKLDKKIVDTYRLVENKKLCVDAYKSKNGLRISSPRFSGYLLWTTALLMLALTRYAGSRSRSRSYR